MEVTVNGLEFADTTGWPEGTPLYRLDVTAKNFSAAEPSVRVYFRCENTTDKDGDTFQGSVDLQGIPGRSQVQGPVLSTFPLRDDDTNRPALAARECTKGVIWITLEMGGTSGRAGGKPVYRSAYIPLPPATLEALSSQADAAFAAQASP